MSKEIRSEIIDAVTHAKSVFYHEHGTEPKAVHLTQEIAHKIEQLTEEDIGALAGGIFTKGVRAKLTQLVGLEIKSWDADTIKVE